MQPQYSIEVEPHELRFVACSLLHTPPAHARASRAKSPLPSRQLEAIFDVSGVSCEVLQGGVVAVGDAVCPEPADSPAHATVRDLGSQPPGYFVRPSKRTAGMLRGASLHMAGTLERVMKDDPDGAVRVEAAYESVGLRFWPASSWDAAAVLRRRRQRRQSLAACAAIAVALAAAGVAAMAVGVIAMKLQGDV